MRRWSIIIFIGIFIVSLNQPNLWSMEGGIHSGLEDLQVDPHSGSASLAYPIIVPPGRGGIQPDLSISYNSNNRNGMLGMGWVLEIGSIVRSSRNGIPVFDDSDIFVLNQNGSTQKLVKEAATGLYHPEIEAVFLKIEKLSASWKITDRAGVKYFFGESPEDREEEGEKVIRWALNRVEDVHGNFLEIDYFKDGNTLYPKEIRYTGHAPSALTPYAKVAFEYDKTRGDAQTTYVMGIKLTTAWRLQRIKVYANVGGTVKLQRRYEISYQMSPKTGRSLLATIRHYGKDDTAQLPVTTFSYENNAGAVQEYLPVVKYDSALSSGGDRMWYTMVHAGNVFDHNGATLYPQYNGNIFQGQFLPQGNVINWNGAFLKNSYADHTWAWTINNTIDGKLFFQGVNDTAFKAWTNIYLNQTRQVNFNSSGAPHKIYMDQNYSQPLSGGLNTIGPGFHLIEVVAYQQTGASHYNFNVATGLAGQVDYMNSVVVNTPSLPADFNGDGYVDIGRFISTDGKIKIMLANGNSFEPETVWLEQVASNENVLTGDFNGDGKMDIVRYTKSSGLWKVALSNGNGQLVNQGNAWLVSFGANEEPSTGDINGDGLTDVFTFYKSGGQWKTRVALNQGNSFVSAPEHTYTLGNQNFTPIVGNFNGDGLIDFGTFDKPNGNWTILLNKGLTSDQFNALDPVNGFGAGKATVVADFNADGLTDIGYYNPATGQIFSRVSDGGGFDNVQAVAVTFSLNDVNVQVQAQDFNGDGLADWIVYDTLGKFEIAYSNASISDLLVSVDNGIGAKTDIFYKPSTAFPNTFLPFVIPVIGSTTVRVLNESYMTRYEYAGGLWDSSEREFRGFAAVKVIDPENNYSKSYFSQDTILKGRLEKQETFDQNNNLFSKTSNVWDHQMLPNGAKFVFLKRKDNFVYDGNVSGRRSTEEFFYSENPQYGNLTKAVQRGEVDLSTGNDIGNDSRTVETFYIRSTAAPRWLLGLPKQIIIRDNGNNIVRQTWFYYDNHAGIDDQPDKGLLTKKEEWGGGGLQDINPVTTYGYDVYGNLKTTVDPAGHQTVPANHQTTITYDTTYQLFPVTTANALGHTVQNKYYGVSGESLDDGQGYSGLWGQLKSTTDPNNQKGQRSYDAFGRMTKTISPLDTVNFPTTESMVEFLADHVRVTAKQRVMHGQAKTITTVGFTDGLGRAIQSKSPTYLAGQFTVSGQTEYNSRGLAGKQYLPYYTTTAVNSINPINAATPYTSIEYDVMGRVVKTVNPDGTYSTVIYDDWKTMAIDENGHKQESEFDAYGRLIEKKDYTGADGRSPDYPSAPYTMYATTKYEYDSEGNLVKTIDAQQNQTLITYDKLGRKISMDDPDMGHWEYKYDPNGNLIEQKDASLKTIFFSYDALNRLTRKYDNAGMDVSYTYDTAGDLNSKGRLTDAGYAGGNAEFKYDIIGREIESVKLINGMAYNVNRNYDALNNVLNIRYPDQQQVFYQYNDAGQVKRVSNYEVPQPTAPAAPVLNNPVAGNGQVSLAWNTVSGATGYRVKYGVSAANLNLIKEANGNTSIVIGGLNNNAEYSFAVVAYNAVGESPISNIKNASPSAGIMDITLDTTTNYNTTAKTAESINHTVASSGSNRVLIVAVELYDTSVVPQTSTLTYGGQTMTLVGRASRNISGTTNMTSEIWYLLNPPTGTNALAVGFNTNVNEIGIQVTSLQGVKQAAPEVFTTNTNTNNAPSASVTTLTNKAWVVDAVTANVSLPSNMTIGAGQSLLGSRDMGANQGASSYKMVNPAGGTTIQWTLAFSTKDWTIVAAAFAPAPLSAALEQENAMMYACEFPPSPEESDRPNGWDRIGRAAVKLGRSFLSLFTATEAHADELPVTVNFNAFTEIEPADNITRTSDCVTFNDIETRQTNAYVYKEHTISGDFVFEFDSVLSAAETFAGQTLIWGVANDVGTFDDWNNPKIMLAYEKTGSTTLKLKLTTSTTTTLTGSLSQGLRYYIRVAKTGSTVTVSIYNNPSMQGAPVGTLTKTDAAGSFSYLYGFSTRSGTSTPKKMTGDVCRMKTNAGSGIVPLPPQDFVQDVEYNAAGQITRVVYGNGVVTQNFYNNQFRLTRIYTINAQGSPLQDLSYAYDSAGNIKSITDAVHSADQMFKYDHLNRLTQAIAPESYGTKTYAYDTIGNIMTKDGKTYNYGEGPAGPHAVTRVQGGGQPTMTYTYDANGNMLTKQEQDGSLTEYRYDIENRLLDVKKDGTLLSEFRYDGDGGRTRKLTSDEDIRFVGSLYEEAGSRASSYVFLGSARVAQINNGQVFYYHTDHLGGTNVLTDNQGVKKQVLEYLPYGKIVRDEKFGTTAEQDAWYHFTGQYNDKESELYFFNARYYDPELGRFIQGDTIIQDFSNPQTFNRYTYVNNNPVNNIDPDGHGWFKKFVSKFAGFLGFTGGLIKGIVTGDWNTLKNQSTTLISSFVFSGFNPAVAVAATVTTSILDTYVGQEVTQWTGAKIFDDILGISPGAAYILSRVGLQIIGSLSFEKFFAGLSAIPSDGHRPYDPHNPQDKALTDNPKGFNPFGRKPGGQNIGEKGFPDQDMVTLVDKNGDSLSVIGKGKVEWGPFTNLPGSPVHTGAIAGKFPYSSVVSIAPNWQYATIFGTCHQATNATFLAAGISDTVLNINPEWSSLSTTMLYGNYGGGLAQRIHAGIEAQHQNGKGRN